MSSALLYPLRDVGGVKREKSCGSLWSGYGITMDVLIPFRYANEFVNIPPSPSKARSKIVLTTPTAANENKNCSIPDWSYPIHTNHPSENGTNNDNNVIAPFNFSTPQCGSQSQPVTVFCVGITTKDGCFFLGSRGRFKMGRLYPTDPRNVLIDMSPLCIDANCVRDL